MKRDKELAQKILAVVAECQDPAGLSSTDLLSLIAGTQNAVQAIYDERYLDITHHIELLTAAGFLLWRGRDPQSEKLEDLIEPTFYHVTWAGHDLLDSLIQSQRG